MLKGCENILLWQKVLDDFIKLDYSQISIFRVPTFRGSFSMYSKIS